jgi:IS30 family transposase
MAHWTALAMEWDVDVYFADAHSPWQRGQNENGNRQLRYWLPKGTDLTVHPQTDLDAICDVLNTQPRRSLAWKSPNDLYAAHAAR